MPLRDYGPYEGSKLASSTELASTAETWDGMTREQVILKYAPLVKYVAGRIHMKLPPSVDPEDLYQSGILGLIDAVAKFDPSRGFKFQTYAEFRIRGAIIDELRSMDWVPRAVRQNSSVIEDAYLNLELQLGRPAEDEEVARYLSISLAEFYAMLDDVRSISIVSFDDIRTSVEDDERDIMEVLADPEAIDPVEAIGLKQLRQAMSQAIASLPAKERLVITLYYYEELTMQEIGHILKLTESRISQLHSKAAMRIRARIRRHLG